MPARRSFLDGARDVAAAVNAAERLQLRARRNSARRATRG